MKLSTGKQRRMPIHFSRSMNNALTFFFKLHSKLDLTFSNCWCCASASCNFRCSTVTESCMSFTSWTRCTWAKSLQKANQIVQKLRIYTDRLSKLPYLHCSTPARWPRASNRVCATFNGSDFCWMARRSKSIFRSMSKISCCVLCKCNWILFFASHTSDERLFSVLFVVLQQSQTALFTQLINASAILRSWEDVARTDCDLRIKIIISTFHFNQSQGGKCIKRNLFIRALLASAHISMVLTVGSYFSMPP